VAKAVRSDLAKPQRDGESRLIEKCSSCDISYAISVLPMEDVELIVKLLRDHLPTECPEHRNGHYAINEDLHHPRRVIPISN